MALTLEDLLPKPSNIEIVHPLTGEQTGAYITVHHIGSDEMYKIRRKVNKEIGDETDQEISIVNFYIALVPHAIIGWDEQFFGPFGKEAVNDLCSDIRKRDIVSQVAKGLIDRSRFFR